MRVNKYVALATGMSRRAADAAIELKRVRVNGTVPPPGYAIGPSDKVTFDNKLLVPPKQLQTIMLNKPVDYVCSRQGQGNKTIYELLPPELHELKPVGRLDKDSSGLLLLTNDGELANKLTHPRYEKEKVYEIVLNTSLDPEDWQKITKHGVKLEDGLSKLQLDWLEKNNDKKWRVTMHEGRNRQIRRTFETLGYRVRQLHRVAFGPYHLENVGSGAWQTIDS